MESSSSIPVTSERMTSRKRHSEGGNKASLSSSLSSSSFYSKSNCSSNLPHLSMKKFCIVVMLVTSILIVFLSQAPIRSSEAAKVLKKAKKYVYLLAPGRKKLYAFPVPVPLPVFVKRQHIYTQVPVLPRYVQQPYYGQASNGGNSYSGGGGGSGSESYDPYYDYQQLSASSQQQVSYQQVPSSTQQQQQQQFSSNPSKYLAQLANALGQAYPILGASAGAISQRDLVGKLLTGQAKLVPPSQLRASSLIAQLKQQQAYAAALAAAASHEQQQQQSIQQGRSPSPSASQSLVSSLASAAANSTVAQDNNNKKQQQQQQAASEIYLNVLRHQQQQQQQQQHPYASEYPVVGEQQQQLYRMTPSMLQAMAPYLSQQHAAAIAAASAAQQLSGSIQSPGSDVGSAEMMADVQPQLVRAAAAAAANQLAAQDEAGNQDAAASSEYQIVSIGGASRLPRHLSQGGPQQTQAAANERERILDAMQHQQAALRSAIVARKQEEAQLAQSNSLAITAHQLGIPLMPGQLRLINY